MATDWLPCLWTTPARDSPIPPRDGTLLRSGNSGTAAFEDAGTPLFGRRYLKLAETRTYLFAAQMSNPAAPGLQRLTAAANLNT